MSEEIDMIDNERQNVKWSITPTNHPNHLVYINGQVYSKKYKRLLSRVKDKDGYLTVGMDGKTYKVHRLVYETFVGPIPKGCQIHHKDKNKENCNLDNLICLTPEQHHQLHSNDEETCFKRGSSKRGRKLSQQTKKKLSLAKQEYNKTHQPWNKGLKGVYKHSEETKEKMKLKWITRKKG